MRNVRCACGKIVCQVASLVEAAQSEGVPPSLESPAVLILCRHCKRYVVLQVAVAVEPAQAEGKAGKAHLLSVGM